MADYDLGLDPPGGTFYLPKDADFVAALKRKSPDDNPPEPWPVGSTIELRFVTTDPATPVAVWESTPDDIYMRWNVDKVDCASVAALKPKTVRLRYVEGDVELLWSVKTVRAV